MNETRPACPVCMATMKRRDDDWECDLHGARVPLFVERDDEDPLRELVAVGNDYQADADAR